MALLIDAVGGRYASAWNSVNLGITEQGYDLTMALKEEVINESDAIGGSMADFFYRGGDCALRADSKEYIAGAIAAMWPFGALGQIATSALPIGRLASDAAKPLVLTATAGTPAATRPATLTGTNSILAPGQNSTLLFNSKLRRVPIFHQFLPYVITGSTIGWFVTT